MMHCKAIPPAELKPKEWSEIIELHKRFVTLDPIVIERSIRTTDLIYLFYNKGQAPLIATITARWIEFEDSVVTYLGHAIVNEKSIRGGVMSQAGLRLVLKTYIRFWNKKIYTIWFATSPAAYGFARKKFNCWPRVNEDMPEELNVICNEFIKIKKASICDYNPKHIIVSSIDGYNNPVRMTKDCKELMQLNNYEKDFYTLNPNGMNGSQLLIIANVTMKHIFKFAYLSIASSIKKSWYYLTKKLSYLTRLQKALGLVALVTLIFAINELI